MTEGEVKRHDDVARAKGEAERFRVRVGCVFRGKEALNLFYHQTFWSLDRSLFTCKQAISRKPFVRQLQYKSTLKLRMF